MKILALATFVTVLLSGGAIAQGPSEISQLERSKAKVVSRLYQAIYGHAQRCKKASPDAASEYKNEVGRFSEANAGLLKLVIVSPYYAPAKQKFSKHENPDQTLDTPESLAGECKALAQLVRSMNDSQEGKKAVKEYEALLSK